MHFTLVALVAVAATADVCPPGVDPHTEAERLLAAGQTTSSAALVCAQQALGTAGAAAPEAQRLLGRVLEDRGDWDAARDTYRKALALWRAHREREALAEGLADLASVEFRRGDSRAAGQALRELTLVAPAASAAHARRLMLDAQMARVKADYEQALVPAREALRLWLALGQHAAERVATLNQLGELEWFLGHFERARDWHQQALALARAEFGGQHPATGTTLANLALVALMLGDLAEAFDLEREALTVTKAARGDEHPETIDRLQDLASLDVEAGNYALALSGYEQVLELCQRRFGAGSDQSAHVVYNLGLTEARLGRPARAVTWLEQALSIWERIHGRQHPYVAYPLDQLANAASDLGQLDRAATYLARAARVRAGAGPGARFDRAWNLARLSDVRRRQGRLGEARRLGAQALDLCNHAGPSSKDVAPTLGLLGDVERALGHYASARVLYESSLSIMDRLYGPTHPRSASLRARLAATLAQLGDAPGALDASVTAERMRRAHVRHTIRYLAETQALDFARQEPEGRDVLISLAASKGAARASVAAAFAALASSRALVMDEMAARHTDAAPVQNDRLQALRRRLAQLLYRQWDGADVLRVAALESTQRELERLEQRGTATTAHEPADASETDAARLGTALPPGAALLSYVRYRDVATSAMRYAAFVLRTGESEPRVFDLAPAAGIETRIATWRAQLSDMAGSERDPALIERRAAAAGRDLAALLWDPLADALAASELILVVPDGPLALLNFAALPDSSGTPLVDLRAVMHGLSAERDVLRWQRPAVPPASLLALGGPDYDASTAGRVSASLADTAPGLGLRSSVCGAERTTRFEFLPEAAAEGEELLDIWERTQDSRPARLLLGSAATETAFKEAAPRAGVLHLATHGFFENAECTAVLPAREARGAPADNPLVAAGLALAGANRGAADETQEDGLLTAAEVAQLDLRATRWVVLSACGSGLGRVQHGEGVLGLQRAFAMAGADTVVMSLWPVSDRNTRLFMRALYRARFQKGSSSAAALRAAEVELREHLRHELGAAPPSLWAAFVAVGDWR